MAMPSILAANTKLRSKRGSLRYTSVDDEPDAEWHNLEMFLTDTTIEYHAITISQKSSDKKATCRVIFEPVSYGQLTVKRDNERAIVMTFKVYLTPIVELLGEKSFEINTLPLALVIVTGANHQQQDILFWNKGCKSRRRLDDSSINL
ncbi:uncharacterized protein KY384_005005 [Bacidia gigantensis]|uniref:uncharacterized protein n=1 Tax=Bacidia gigantensis TaxID=2732470 RepID=UPI001D0549D7|nr:uncharacterized protein KY384_005005 [Bacidia gigantensis]KAG8530502.1 hypothetical protein KY384_005005 [Bacidia gigantensis]